MSRKTIMLVDDEEAILKVVGHILKQKGYIIIKAKSGNEALNKLKKIKPDLILIDFFMPEMSGRELCEKIRADNKLQDVKVAFLTVAQFSKSGMKILKQMNICDYIQKPFDSKDLIKRINKYLKVI